MKANLTRHFTLFIGLMLVVWNPNAIHAQSCQNDQTPPMITNCPADVTFNLGAGSCDTMVRFLLATVMDDCDQIGFADDFDPANWTYQVYGAGGGTVALINNAPDSVAIRGTSNGTGGLFDTTELCFTFPVNGTFSIDWMAQMSNFPNGGFNNDEAYFLLNGVETVLASGGGNNTASGSIMEQVVAGDVICFRVRSHNQGGGFNILTLDNLVFNQSALNPDTPAPLIFGGGAALYDLITGTTTINWIATDSSGNESTCSFDVTVSEPIPPVITCPADVTIDLDSSECTSVWCYSVTATDNCEGNLITDVPGLQYIGTYNGHTYFVSPVPLFTRRTWDDANAYAASLGGHLVTVEDAGEQQFLSDNIPFILFSNTYWIGLRYSPSIGGFKWVNGTPLTYTNWGFGQPGIIEGEMVFYWDFFGTPLEGWYDFDGDVPNRFIVEFDGDVSLQLLSGLPSGAQFPPGETEVVYQATDASGNTATCSFTVTVVGSHSITCKNINLSLEESCVSEVTPDMVITGFYNCLEVFEITLTDQWGVPVGGNIVDHNYIGQTLTYNLEDLTTGNSCWGTILVEDKFAPQITCQDDTMNCIEFIHNFDEPMVIENCTDYELILLNEVTEKLECDTAYIKRVTQTYIAKDAYGNVSDTCSQEILIERFPLADVIPPPADTTLYCGDDWARDAEGIPLPEVTGVPRLDSLLLWPTPDFYCNVWVAYHDVDLGETGCVRNVLRYWGVSEWWCTEEIPRFFVQYIHIVDTVGPELEIDRDTLTAYTNKRSCAADVWLPGAVAPDACHGTRSIDINYPGGFHSGDGSVFLARLPVGHHVVYYTAYDSCYNSTTDSIEVWVKDKTPPVAVCEEHTVASLNNHGFALIAAEDFDDGSFDECSIDYMEVRRMDSPDACDSGTDDWGPNVEVCCADIGEVVMVAFRVVDKSGNSGTCMVQVEVQDKYPPHIICPPDITVDCRFDYDESKLDVFGKIVSHDSLREAIVIDADSVWFSGPAIDGLAYDNCPMTIVQENDLTNINNCGLGYLIRWFYVFDGQELVGSCGQRIDFVNVDTFGVENIIWPEDLDTLNVCDVESFHPDLLPEEHGYPMFEMEDECALVGATYEDDVIDFSVSGDACFKIIRRWKVIDWCQFTNGQFEKWTHDQIIKVHNDVEPEITSSCADTMKCFYTADCEPGDITLFASAMDDCTPEEELYWTYKIDLNDDGDYDIIGHTSSVTDSYEVDTHRIHWIVEDRCGNSSMCDYTFEIRNCKSPTAYCKNGVVAELTPMDTTGDGIPDAEMATIWAIDFDAGSNHPCGYGVVLSFSEDTTDTRRDYDCDSLANGGVRPVTIWVTDEVSGNVSKCETFVLVQDNNNVDICPQVLRGTISGLVRTEEGGLVEDVEVYLDRSGGQMRQTDEEGKYSFEDMELGSSYGVRPYKNDEVLNGVSTGDIVKIQKYLLDKEDISSGYKMLAADVNGSGSVTASDITTLRKVILGKEVDFVTNTSWRFVDEDYVFVDPGDPFAHEIRETKDLDPFDGDVEVDFIGVKVGDVNGDVRVNGLNGTIVRSSERLVLDVRVREKDEARSEVLFSSDQLEEVEGFQFTLSYGQGIVIEEVLGNASQGVGAGNFGLHRQDQGELMMSWNGEGKAGEWLFKVVVKRGEEGSLLRSMRITSAVTRAEAYGLDGSLLGLEMRIGEARVKEGSVFALYANEPNPWSDQTRIGFDLPEDGMATLTVFDQTGKKLAVRSGLFHKGYNAIVLKKNEISATGVLYYRLKTDDHSAVQKMILIP